MNKARLTILLFVVFIVLLACTKPDQSDYEKWQIERWTEAFDEKPGAAVNLSGTYIFENNTQRKNLWICSVFTTNMATRSFSYLGIMDTFIPLQSDDFIQD